MNATQSVLHVLHSAPAHRIRFSFPSQKGGNATINAASFSRVATAIQHREIKVQAFETRSFVFYKPGKSLFVSPLHGRLDEGQLLGACVDAFFSVSGQHITANDQFSVKLLVSTLYYRMTGLSRGRWSEGLNIAAGKVAEAVLHEYQRGHSPIPAVDRKLWADLNLAVMRFPDFNDELTMAPQGVYGTIHGLEAN